MAIAREQGAALEGILRLFFDGAAAPYQVINTSRDEADFRETVLVETEAGRRFVLKLADNDFTTPARIGMWQRTAEEYRALGYYCPRIYAARSGGFPTVEYGGRRCLCYAEDFAAYRSVADRAAGETEENGKALAASCREAVWTMTAKIAARRLDYTDFPSAYCLFETFSPGDEVDEVLENARDWKQYAETLPAEFAEQVRRIWDLWTENRAALEAVYPQLPRSVFQADLNPTNLLVDESGQFVGVFDFNLCGRDVFLNYLMRENYGDFEAELDLIFDALEISARNYPFSELEKETALPLYRCLKPLAFTKLYRLKALGTDRAAVQAFLDKTEHYLTAPIDFAPHMAPLFDL